MNLSKETLNSMIEKIQRNADMFYQQNKQEAFDLFGNLINDISELSAQIFAWKNTNPASDFDETKYLSVLTEAMNALEAKDEVLLADILNYDLTEIYETIQKQL
ncbi:MAG: hypothetical protein PUC65_04095 [Clostridiales bacterium]|nr:hypothetical protein [Clostridiales bacterium]